MIRKTICYPLCLLFTLLHFPARAEQEVLGWLEAVYLQPWGIRLRTKLDTGARTSSIHVTGIETYHVDDQLWVRFTIPYRDKKDDPELQEVVLERPVIREARIKEHVGESVSRYVVEIEFCLNGKHYATPFTLADRSNFNYPMLLGRTTMKGNVMVDPGRTFTANKSCE